jgi:hypothetical protein
MKGLDHPPAWSSAAECLNLCHLKEVAESAQNLRPPLSGYVVVGPPNRGGSIYHAANLSSVPGAFKAKRETKCALPGISFWRAVLDH